LPRRRKNIEARLSKEVSVQISLSKQGEKRLTPDYTGIEFDRDEQPSAGDKWFSGSASALTATSDGRKATNVRWHKFDEMSGLTSASKAVIGTVLLSRDENIWRYPGAMVQVCLSTAQGGQLSQLGPFL
jgi:hypothetical protein